MQRAGGRGAVEKLGHNGQVAALALETIEGTEGEKAVEFFTAAHPLGGGVFLHEGVEGAQGVGLAQAVQLDTHIARKGVMVEVVVGKAQVGKVVADQTAVAVGFANVEGKAGKLNLAVCIGNVHGGFVDKSGFAPLPVLSLGGLAKVFQPWGKG